MGILTALNRLGNTETIEDYEEIIMINPLLVQAWANIEKSTLIKEVKKGANSTKGGSTTLKKYKTPEIKVVDNKEELEKMTKILKGEKNKSDNEIGEK